MLEEKEKKKSVKDKIDRVLDNKPKDEPEEVLDKDTPSLWTPFAKKIYTDMKLYVDKMEDGSYPTRAVATKFRNDIEDKLEPGKEKDAVIKWYNKKFRLPGVSTLPWNYFAESVIDPKAGDKAIEAMQKGIEKILEEMIDIKINPDGKSIEETAKEIIAFINKKENTSIIEKI